MERILKIGEAARRLGVHPNTLRRWEEHGLIHPFRTPLGTRLYPEGLLAQILKEGHPPSDTSGGINEREVSHAPHRSGEP